MFYSCPVIVSASTPYVEHEVGVKNGLSYTPSEMNEMTAKGKAVSLDALSGSSYFETAPDNMPLPIHMQRGVDMNDAFEQQYESHENISRFKKHVDDKQSTNQSNVQEV